MAFADLYTETFSPMLLVLPIVFIQIGVVNATLVLAAVTVMQGICARLNFECTRLQQENLYFDRNEDFETLITNPRVGNSILIALFSKMYPIKLVLNSAIAIMICSIVAD